jgi:hypothetical protein
MTADSRWIANQSLPGVSNVSGIQGQLGTGSVGNYAGVPNDQYYAYEYEAIPEPHGIALLALLVLGFRGTRCAV